MNYIQFKQKREKSISDLPLCFAFSNLQLEEAMKDLGLNISETDQIISIGGGGIIRKSDQHLIKEAFENNEKEFSELMKDDVFFTDALRYELGNHEYCISYDPEPALESLNLTMKQISADERMRKLFVIAKEKYFEGVEA